MLLFPRSDDVSDLKRLIKKKIYRVKREGRGKYSSFAEYFGSTTEETYYQYDISTKIESFYFDSEHIYSDKDEEISLADILINSYIETQYIDDEVVSILAKRNLQFEDQSTVAGYTEPVYYEGENYASEDITYSVKKVVKIT
ncbi:MAG: hypothetical protein IJZ79_02305 [Bacilli bacterium]|nr:hypothetical protein [Bacilli bacterium]